MYWLHLQLVAGVGIVFLYGMVWHLGSGVARWDATMVACAKCSQEFVCGFELVFPELVLEKSLELAH